jgi:predicted ribosome quality control (RQC) complex YloA/Tae2 family protein
VRILIRNYYTLTHISKELESIEGTELVDCFTQDKGVLIMIFFDGKRENVVEYSTVPSIDTIFLRKRFSRARKNTLDLFPDIKNKIIKKIDLIKNDRVFHFDFGDVSAYFFLFGGSRNNCFIVQNGNIIDSFKDPSKNINKKFEISRGNVRQLHEFSGDTNIKTALAKCDLLLGNHYADEVCKRSHTSPSIKIKDIDETEFKNIIANAEHLTQELITSSKYHLYMTDKKEWLISLILLQNSWDLIEEYTSISEAIQNRVINTIRDRSFSTAYNEINNHISRELKKIEINLSNLDQSEKTKERAENYRKWADLLIAQPNTKAKPGEKIELTDWEGRQIVINLDPKLNLIQNSEKYYERASKSLQSIKEREKLLPKMLNRKEILTQINNKLKNAKSVKELDKIKNDFKKIAGLRMNIDNENKETKFRTFDLGEGYTLYVGKNAANNDELTMKFAKPNDLWFHARGAGGSHVVLRLDKGDKPGRHIIDKAASIAAYYSQQRKAKLTPVCYTYKKYVRKPKGANPGTVVLAREDVTMAKPRSPEEM